MQYRQSWRHRRHRLHHRLRRLDRRHHLVGRQGPRRRHRPAAPRLRPRHHLLRHRRHLRHGEAETILREALGDKRDEIVIATKFGYDIYNNPDRRASRSARTTGRRHTCARRSKQLAAAPRHGPHRPLPAPQPPLDAIQRDDLWAELTKAKDEGLIRAFGTALGPAFDMRQIEEGARPSLRRRTAPPQIIYNLLEQGIGARHLRRRPRTGVSVLRRACPTPRACSMAPSDATPSSSPATTATGA